MIRYIFRHLLTIFFILAFLSPLKTAHAQANAVPILVYHHIDNHPGIWHVGTLTLEYQLKYLVDNGYHAISMETYMDARDKGTPLPDKPVILTFDDGYRDAYENAFRLLKKYGLTGTFYVIAGYVGNPEYLTWDEIKDMQQAGMEIGAHTMHHPFLTKLPWRKAYQEIWLSRLILSLRLDVPITTFAYPYNDHNARVVALARTAGFRSAAIVTPHKGDNLNDPFEVQRITIMPGQGIKLFGLLVNEEKFKAPVTELAPEPME